MKTYQYYWQLIRYRPRYYFLLIFNFTLHASATTALGLILRAFFNRLTGDAGFQLSLGPVLLAQGVYTTVLVSTLALAAMGFINFQGHSMALLVRNLFARTLEMPASSPLPLKKDGSRLSSGEVLSTLRDDPELMLNGIVLINDVTAYGVTALIALAIMLRIDPLVTAGTFIPLGLVVWLANWLGQRAKLFRAASREATSQVTGLIGDIFNATQAIQVNSAEERVVAALRQANERRRVAMVRDRLISQLVDALSNGTVDLGLGLILLLAARAMFAGHFTVGDFALFAAYIWPVTQMMRLAGNVVARYRQVSVSTERLAAMMQGAPAAAVVAHHPIYMDGHLPSLPYREKEANDRLEVLEVKGLSFSYPGSSEGIREVSFTLRRGSLTVVTGRLGSGKSTLLKVLLGLLPADAGSISWNGRPVPDPATFLLPPRAAYTGQVPRLFSDSLRQNILLGLPEERVDLAAALETAVLQEDVARMEQGLDTPVGPRGVRLSGGQAQRSAVARMVVRQAELLLMDDLSSALDVDTEQTLWQRLLARPDRPTCLAVSHRRALLRQAEQVLVLKEGRLEDAGTLEQLLQRCPEMQHLWQREIV